ncbi:protein translocase subunit SecD [Pseudonocardia acaciae]|uniref:protein translocase subunit SecD n=1 Tax=Pseudonocardia acaciae TaxID=551276 RepID=UPI00049065F8|nr:protein translocase subunit SecD [Pseudonocardia acaciae]
MAPPAGTIRPWRYLATFVGIVIVLYALVFYTGDRKPNPKLGIDLQGGTRVTLTARTETGQPPTKEQLILARGIIDERVNGLGVNGAEVVQDGSNLTITVPGDQGDRAKDLAQTAQLRFRPVLGAYDAAAPQPGPGGQPAPGQTPGQTAPGQPGGAKPGQQPAPSGAPGPGSAAPHGSADLARALDAPPNPHPRPPGHPGQPAPPPPPPPPPPADPGQTAADPQLAKEIALAKAERQSTDKNVQQLALQELRCTNNDVLRGYDDPKKPLISCDQKGTAKYLLGPSFLEGTEIATAASGMDDRGAGYVVNLTFKAEGSRIWADYTAANVGKQAAFVLDSQVVSAPTIEGPIPGGNTRIQGQFSQADAQKLAGVLKYGSLPLSFATSDAETVSATLGLASLQAGLIAGAVGLALVFIWCLFYYRALGMLTILSLVLSGVIVYAVLVLLGRGLGLTLDLAGVAGFIVSIGITADSFVIFFERLKDEVREGRSFRSAVPRAWIRARRTILSADAVTFLASAVLYLLAVGQVKGFAFTLGMSTVLDLVVVFLVTHPLVAMASNSRVFSSPTWSGLGAVARIGAMRRRAAAAAVRGS